MRAHFNKLFSFSFVHSGCEIDLCTFPVRCGGWFSNCCCCFSIAHILSNEKSLSDGWYDGTICLPAWWWNWNCCCWCKMSRIVPMSFLRLSSRWSIRTVRSLIWLVIELKIELEFERDEKSINLVAVWMYLFPKGRSSTTFLCWNSLTPSDCWLFDRVSFGPPPQLQVVVIALKVTASACVPNWFCSSGLSSPGLLHGDVAVRKYTVKDKLRE